MTDLIRGRWDTGMGVGELALVDGMHASIGTELHVLLPADPGHHVWRCRVEGEQLQIVGGTTLVVRALTAEGRLS